MGEAWIRRHAGPQGNQGESAQQSTLLDEQQSDIHLDAIAPPPPHPSVGCSFLSTTCGECTALPGKVVGGSTAAVRDVGGASIRIKIPELEDGGYLLAIRATHSQSRWLPAIGGVPGRRYGQERVGLAELMGMASPVMSRNGDPTEVTFLPDPVLQCHYPEATCIELVVLRRVTNFFLGLNAGRWLQIRMDEIARESVAWLADDKTQGCNIDEFLRGTGLQLDCTVEEPPHDASYLFEHFGMSNNSALPQHLVDSLY